MNTSNIRKLAKESIRGKYFKAILIFLIYILLSSVCVFIPFVGSIALLIFSIPLSYGIISSMIKLKRNENVGYFDFISIAFSEFGNAWKVTFSMLGKLWPYLLGYFGGFIFIIIGSVTAFVMTIGSSIADSSFSDITLFLPLFAMFGIGIIISLVSYILLILKSLYYSLSYYVLYDNSTMSGKEVVEQSHNLMKGHRWDIIKMQIPYYLIIFGIMFLISILFTILSVIYDTEVFTYFINITMYVLDICIIPLIQFATIHFYEELKN